MRVARAGRATFHTVTWSLPDTPASIRPSGENTRSPWLTPNGTGPGLSDRSGAVARLRSRRGRAGSATFHRTSPLVEAAARIRPSGENASPHSAPDKPADSTASRAGCRGRLTFHRAGWPRNVPVATVAPSGEIVVGLPPSNTDSRRGRAWSVTSHRVLVASQGGPLVALTRMR